MTLLKRHVHAVQMAAQILLFSFFGTIGTSQTTGQAGNNGGNRIEKANWQGTKLCINNTNTMCAQLFSDNVLKFKLIVRVAIPELDPDAPISFIYIITNPFSSNPSPVFTGITPPVSTLSPTVLEDGTPAWEGVFEFLFDLSGECDTNYENLFYELDYMLIQDHGQQGWSPYPIGNHPDLFPPDLFYAPQVAEWQEEEMWICCYGNGAICPTSLLANDNPQTDPTSFQMMGPSTGPTATVSPNPLEGQSTIFWKPAHHLNNVELNIYNMHGGLMATKFFNGKIDEEFEATISTLDWPSGTYYFQLKSEKHTTIVKTFKIK